MIPRRSFLGRFFGLLTALGTGAGVGILRSAPSQGEANPALDTGESRVVPDEVELSAGDTVYVRLRSYSEDGVVGEVVGVPVPEAHPLRVHVATSTEGWPTPEQVDAAVERNLRDLDRKLRTGFRRGQV